MTTPNYEEWFAECYKQREAMRAALELIRDRDTDAAGIKGWYARHAEAALATTKGFA